jgi:CheY-like chemotaxis protein
MSSRTSHPQSSPPLVLIADDNEDARDMYSAYLSYAGFRVATAIDGADAIEIARREQPSVILMDATMPVLDGWAAIEQLKRDAELKHIPVLMLTAHVFPEHEERARRLGAGFLRKPCLPDDLLEAVRSVLGRRHVPGS